MLIIAGCDPCKRLAKRCPPIIKDSLIYSETIIQDSNYTIPDSMYYALEFYCDSNYNVLLRELQNYNTGIESEISIISERPDNELIQKNKVLLFTVKAKTDSILSLNNTIEKLKNNVRIIEVPKEVVKYKSRKIFIWSFVILLILIIGGITFIILKFRKKLITDVLNKITG